MRAQCPLNRTMMELKFVNEFENQGIKKPLIVP